MLTVKYVFKSVLFHECDYLPKFGIYLHNYGQFCIIMIIMQS